MILFLKDLSFILFSFAAVFVTLIIVIIITDVFVITVIIIVNVVIVIIIVITAVALHIHLIEKKTQTVRSVVAVAKLILQCVILASVDDVPDAFRAFFILTTQISCKGNQNVRIPTAA